MTELQLQKLSPNSFYLPFQTEAYMYFPNELDRQNQFIEYLKLKMLHGEASTEHVSISVRQLKSLLEQPAESKFELELVSIYKEASIAGDVLMSIYLMSKFDLTMEPSLNKAFYVLGKRYISAKYPNGKAYPRSKSSIQKIWNKYKLSVPIWAAFRLNANYHYCPSGEETASAKNLDMTLRVAADIFNFASRSVTQHDSTQVPLLDAERSILDNYYLTNPLSLAVERARSPDILESILDEYRAPL
jgi:hypothetical protein